MSAFAQRRRRCLVSNYEQSICQFRLKEITCNFSGIRWHYNLVAYARVMALPRDSAACRVGNFLILIAFENPTR